MKRVRLFLLMFLMLFAFGSARVLVAQDLYYDLKVKSTVKTTDSKDIQRINSCWGNAGTALIEAEMIRLGKGTFDLAEMDFIHNAYLLKAQVYLDTKGKVQVTEKGIALDVFKLMDEYGMAPESAYMKTDMNTMDKHSGEMDAIIRGSLRRALDQGEETLTDRYKNYVDAALSKHIGDTKMEFNYKGKEYTPNSFALESGVNPSDYVMLTTDGRSEIYKSFALELKENWDNDKFFNVTAPDLLEAINDAIKSGFVVGWYGFADAEMIYSDEAVAIVPAKDMPGQKAGDESAEIVYEPVAERTVTDEERQKNFELLIGGTYNYMTLYGISTDKKGNAYIVGKDACTAGNNTVNMSEAFAKLNTVYILLNKNGLSKELKNKLGL
jgi:bleomycin hydrolase